MPQELDRILMCSSRPGFEKKMERFRSAVSQAARLDDQSKENQQVANILRNVFSRGDEAVSEYTKKFDEVQLKPEQFRVSQDELDRANQEIDQDILLCLREAIENVRMYQKDILIDTENAPRGIRYTPIKRVGVCVPGASAPFRCRTSKAPKI